MKRGHLSQYFVGAAAKRLSAVDIDPARSNQHEFGITRPMLDFIGSPDEPTQYPASFAYFPADGSEPTTDEAWLTIYDSRANNPNRGPEYRGYYPSNEATSLAREGDMLVIAQPRDEHRLLVLIAEQGSVETQRLSYLFGFEEPGQRFQSVSEEHLDSSRGLLDFTSKHILELLGITADKPDADVDLLDEMRSRFGEQFPDTRTFSAWARSTVQGVDPVGDPDTALISWVEQEEQLFFLFEKHLLAQALREEFQEGAIDVDRFIKLSLSVHNRRKSRAGHSLELHMEAILRANGIPFTRNGITENRSKPDFVFPSIEAYHSLGFPSEKLFMLGAKSTLKDRWRQVLAEAAKITRKHLLTLEPGLSSMQLAEIKASQVQLVVPMPLQGVYPEESREQLQSLADFIAEMKDHGE